MALLGLKGLADKDPQLILLIYWLVSSMRTPLFSHLTPNVEYMREIFILHGLFVLFLLFIVVVMYTKHCLIHFHESRFDNSAVLCRTRFDLTL